MVLARTAKRPEHIVSVDQMESSTAGLLQKINQTKVLMCHSFHQPVFTIYFCVPTEDTDQSRDSGSKMQFEKNGQ